MRTLLFTTGSPFARAVRIVLDELGLDYERREEITTPSVEQRAAATPTLQVPTFWDGDLTLWESGTIVEYLLSTYRQKKATGIPLTSHAFRPEFEWQDKLVFATIQTFGNAATIISQMKWSGISIEQNAHLRRSADKLSHILGWLENQLNDDGEGFLPRCVSMQDIFLAAHVRFVQARPLGIELGLSNYGKVAALLDRLDERESFKANPIWWWEPGVVGYQPDGTPIYKDSGAT
ncbi:MAG: glutathione S-transferase family protein [Rhizobiaceae bacterium]|nr:glutathione S-transferase family protein [Rhizobiaceae bacterium]